MSLVSVCLIGTEMPFVPVCLLGTEILFVLVCLIGMEMLCVYLFTRYGNVADAYVCLFHRYGNFVYVCLFNRCGNVVCVWLPSFLARLSGLSLGLRGCTGPFFQRNGRCLEESGSQEPLFGADCQTMRLPLHRCIRRKKIS